MKTVAIIGVGLMGGSLGIALRHILKNGVRQYDVIGIGRNIKNLKLAKDKNAVYIPAILNGIFTKPDLKSDMIHPNAKGYALIAQKVHKYIEPYLEQ